MIPITRRKFRILLLLPLILAIITIGLPTFSGHTQALKQASPVNVQIVPGTDETVVGNALGVDINLRGNATVCPAVNARPSLDVVIVFDHSGSMSGTPMRAAKDAVMSFLNLLDAKQDRVGLVIFNQTTNTSIDLTPDFNRVISRLTSFDATGATNIGLGLHKGQQILEKARTDSQKVVVLFSDGGDTVGFFARPSAEKIKQAGVPLLTIGFGDADRTLLRDLATSPSDFVFAPSTAGIREQFTRVASQLVSQVAARNVVVTFHPNADAYAVEPSVITSANVADNGDVEWHLPLLTNDKQVSLPIVLRPLKTGVASIGTATVSYQACNEDKPTTVDLKELSTVQVDEEITSATLFQSGNNLPLQYPVNGMLEASGQDSWLVNVPASKLISVWMDGAGSAQPPRLANNKEFDIQPLIVLRDVGQKGRTLSVYKLKDSGTHWLYVQSAGARDSGRYSLKAEEGNAIKVDDLTELNSSAPYEVKLDVKGSAFRLKAEAGQRITINTQWKFGFGQVKIIDSTSTLQPLQNTNFNYSNATQTYVFDLNGKPPFLAIIQPDLSFARQATYNVSIQENQFVSNDAGELKLDEAADGKLASDHEDIWKFNAKAGDVIESEISGASFTPKVILRGPDGEIVAGNEGDAIAIMRLAQDGTYTFAVTADTSDGSSGSGSYQLTVKKADFATPGELPTDDKVQVGEIQAGKTAEWTFTAKEGDAFSADITPADFNLSLQLINPKGEVISQQDTAKNIPVRYEGFVLDEAGTYKIVVQGTTPTEQGRYQIKYSTAKVPQDLPVFSKDNKPGGTLQPEARDLWQFVASEGDTLSILAKAKGAQVYLELIDPHGVVMADSLYAGLNVSIKRVTAPITGRYTLVVSGSSKADSGDYALEFTPEPSDLGLVNVGETVKGKAAGGMASYEIRADSGKQVTAVLKTSFTGAYPILLDGDGKSIVPDDSVAASQTTALSYTLTGNAPYRLLFRMNGSFELTALDGNTIYTEQGAIKLDEPTKGKVTDYAKVVSYKLDVASGETVSLLLDNKTRKQLIPLQVTDSDGQVVIAQRNRQVPGNSSAVFKLDGKGPFVVSFGAEGDYTVTATSGDILQVKKGALAFDTKTDSKLGAPAQLDRYDVALKEGQIITVAIAGGKNVIPTLRDEANNPVVARNTIRSGSGLLAIYRVVDAGTYSLSIETQGNYSITLTDGDTSQITNDALPLAAIATGILKSGQKAVYPVDVTVGEELYIVVFNSRNSPISMTLLDAKNRSLLIASETAPAQVWSFTAVPAGEGPYTLVLQIEGKYQLMILKKTDLTGGTAITAKASPMRGGPGGTFNAAGQVAKDQPLTALGRDAEGKWIMVLTADNRLGWLPFDKTSAKDDGTDLSSLPEIKVLDAAK